MCKWTIKNMDNFTHIQQEKENSCWVACTAMIINCVCGTDYKDEYEFKLDNNLDLNIGKDQSNPILLLENLGYKRINTRYDLMAMHGCALPTAQEIIKNFDKKGTPLLCCVGENEPGIGLSNGRPLGNAAYQGGHWILIIGIIKYNNNYKLIVADPADKELNTVHMNKMTYKSNLNFTLYWENTSDVNFKPC